MNTPTVAVTIRLNRQDGTPVVGAFVEAKADSYDIFNAFITPDPQRVTTDANGVAVMYCFPNAPAPLGLGMTGSIYRFRAVWPGHTQQFFAQVPNHACELQDILLLEEYPVVDIAQAAAGQAIAAASLSVSAKLVAVDAAAGSSASQLAASNSASLAQNWAISSTLPDGASKSAKSYAADAGVSAAGAASSATSSSTQASNSSSSAGSSAASASLSGTHEFNAGASAASAAASASAANTSAGTSSARASDSSSSAASSQTSSNKSQEWASSSGSPDGTNKSSKTYANDSAASAASSQSSAAGASGSASAAAGSASASQTQAASAAGSASDALASKNTASTQASNASGSAADSLASKNTSATQATNSANSATAAAGSASGAANSATSASTSATNSSNSATSASTSATNSSNSAGAASTQASNASTSATTATTQAGNSSSSATNASGSATAAQNWAVSSTSPDSTTSKSSKTSALEAAGSASSASSSASNASSSASGAGSSATNASTSASNASASASTASTQASNASGSATGAATSASTATTQAGNASTSATNSATSAVTSQNWAVSTSSPDNTSSKSAKSYAADTAALFPAMQGSFSDLTTQTTAAQTQLLNAINTSVKTADLAAATGASGVGFIQPATNAVATTLGPLSALTVSVQTFMTDALRADCLLDAPVLDHTAAINAFFAHLATKNVGSANFSGNFRITGKITASALKTLTINCNARIYAAFSAEDEVLLIQNCDGLTTPGRISIVCTGGTTWSTRTNGIGIRVVSSGRANFDYLEVKFSKYHGVYFDPAYNSGLSSIKLLRTAYCGSAQGATGKSIGFTARTDSGGNGSTGQRSTITLTTASAPDLSSSLALLGFSKFVRIGGYPHLVTAVNLTAGTVDVYPWVDTTLLTGNIDIMGGAGFCAAGGSNSMLNIGTHDATVCGVGYQGDCDYPGYIGTFTSQNCGVAHALGATISGACLGGGIGVAYFEGNYFDLVPATTSQLSYSIGSTTALDLTKCIRVAPRFASNAISDSYSTFTGIDIGFNGYRFGAPTNSTSGTSNLRVAPEPSPSSFSLTRANYQSFTLTPSSSGAAYPFQDLFFVTTGTNGNNAPTQINLIPTAGYSIQGGAVGAALTYSSIAGATMWHAYLNGTDWRISRFTSGDVLTAGVYYPPPVIAAQSVAPAITISIPGAAFGDYVAASFNTDCKGINFSTAYVSSVGVVTVIPFNPTTASVGMLTGVVMVRVVKR